MVAKLPLIAVGLLVSGIIGGYAISGAMRGPTLTPTFTPDPAGTVLAGADEPKTSPCAWNDNPFEGVNADEQTDLQLLTACGLVQGKVQDITGLVQGEQRIYHFTLLPDADYASMANAQNTAQLNGALMVEIEAQDQGLFDHIHVGEHLEVQGPLVTDEAHGWNEIHPAKIVTVL
jgi:hypothetical protein